MVTHLLYTKNITEAEAEIGRNRGKINQLFTKQLFTASLPTDFEVTQLQESTTNIPADLDPTSRLALEGWNRKLKKDINKGLTPDMREGLPWDAEGFQSPSALAPLIFPDSKDATIARSNNTPTSLYLIGSVAVGI